METRLLLEGNVSNLKQLAQALASYAPDIGLSPDVPRAFGLSPLGVEEWDQMLVVLRELFLRLLDGPLEVNAEAAENKKPADESFKKARS